jgi:hypothetical protein
MEFLVALALSTQDFHYAPFILQQEDAVYVDDQLDVQKCKFEKKRYSRWYWFDGVAQGSKHIIDRMTVRFAIVDDNKRSVVAMASPPFDTMKVNIKAIGTYKLSSNTTEVTCA